MHADLRRSGQGAHGRGEGADIGGVRHQSRYGGKADDAPCLGARARLPFARCVANLLDRALIKPLLRLYSGSHSAAGAC
jgi:hypothetical protein